MYAGKRIAISVQLTRQLTLVTLFRHGCVGTQKFTSMGGNKRRIGSGSEKLGIILRSCEGFACTFSPIGIVGQVIINRTRALGLADYLFPYPANPFFQVLFRPANVIFDSLRHAFAFFSGQHPYKSCWPPGP